LRVLNKDVSVTVRLMQVYYKPVGSKQDLSKPLAEEAETYIGSEKHTCLDSTVGSAVHKLIKDDGEIS
jgi:hypothetical protein